jgi:hypothetical protein
MSFDAVAGQRVLGAPRRGVGPLCAFVAGGVVTLLTAWGAQERPSSTSQEVSRRRCRSWQGARE